jgi:uncharacterized protein
METKTSDNGKVSQIQRLHVLSELVGRMTFASRLGTQQYGGDRDIYQALGYKETIQFDDYYGRYTRQDIAKAVIDRPAKITWKGNIEVLDTNDDIITPLEGEWKKLERRLKLKNKFVRVDRLSGIGRYGVLLLGLNDARNSMGFQLPVRPFKGLDLLYVKPLSEKSAIIDIYEKDPKNPRYGLPLFYKIPIRNSDSGMEEEVRVHYSRIIHVVDDLLESEVIGSSRLEPVFNRLMDLEKIVGGDAEMFWRGARPGYHGKVSDDYQITDNTLNDLQDQIDEFEHNLRRILINEGLDLKALEQQIADPIPHVDIQMQMISSVTGIPKRVLVGSERGELASSQDKAEWLEFVQSRREEFAEPHVIRPFIDHCIEIGVLPRPVSEDYNITWSDLFSVSEKDKAEIGRIRSTALREYTSQPTAEMILPPDAFMEYFLGLSSAQIELVNEIRSRVISEEGLITRVENEILEKEKQPKDV